LYEDDDFKLYFKRDLVKLSKNIECHLNKANKYHNKDIDSMTPDQLQK
jgi:hypothetical protein